MSFPTPFTAWRQRRPRLSADAAACLVQCALACTALGLAAYLNFLFWHFTEWRLALTNDSGGYVGWYPLRQPGYTAFLRLVEWLSGNLRWAGLAQLNLLLLAYILLAYHFARLVNSKVCGLALLLLLGGILPLLNLASHIMTEAPFAAMVCLHLASLCCYLRRRSLLAAFWVGATVFLIFIVRPNGLPFAASLLLLALLPPPPEIAVFRRLKTLLVACLPIAAGLLLSAWGNKMVYGAFALPSSGGPLVAGYVGPLLRAGDGAGSKHAALLDELAAMSQEQQARIASADWPEELARTSAASSVTAHLAFRVYQRNLVEHLGGRPPDKRADYLRYREASALATDLAWLIIKAHLQDYLRLVTANHYVWWRHGLFTAYTGEAYLGDLPGVAKDAYYHSRGIIGRDGEFYARHLDTAHYLDANAAARYGARAGASTLPGHWWRLLIGQRAAIVLAVLLLSILSFARLLTRHRCDLAVWFPAYLAFLLHATVSLSVAVHPYHPRYPMPFYPLLFLFLVAIALSLVRHRGVCRA